MCICECLQQLSLHIVKQLCTTTATRAIIYYGAQSEWNSMPQKGVLIYWNSIVLAERSCMIQITHYIQDNEIKLIKWC